MCLNSGYIISQHAHLIIHGNTGQNNPGILHFLGKNFLQIPYGDDPVINQSQYFIENQQIALSRGEYLFGII